MWKIFKKKPINITLFYIETENDITGKMIDLSIGQEFNLDGYDIRIDPYILASENKIRIIINKDNEYNIKDIDKNEIRKLKIY